MDEATLSRMARRRGYRCEPPTREHPGTYSILRGAPEEAEEIAAVSLFVLPDLEVGQLAAFLDQSVSLHHPMQHHVACRRCRTPLLLHRTTDRALFLLQHATHTSLRLRLDEEGQLILLPPELPAEVSSAIQTEYRLATLGPASTPSTHCPACGTFLAPWSVGRIADT